MRECGCDSSVGLRDIFKLLVQNYPIIVAQQEYLKSFIKEIEN